MSKEDWIILRLLVHMAHTQPKMLVGHIDPTKAILYLHKKYGRQEFIKCCRQLEEERA